MSDIRDYFPYLLLAGALWLFFVGKDDAAFTSVVGAMVILSLKKP